MALPAHCCHANRASGVDVRKRLGDDDAWVLGGCPLVQQIVEEDDDLIFRYPVWNEYVGCRPSLAFVPGDKYVPVPIATLDDQRPSKCLELDSSHRHEVAGKRIFVLHKRPRRRDVAGCSGRVRPARAKARSRKRHDCKYPAAPMWRQGCRRGRSHVGAFLRRRSFSNCLPSPPRPLSRKARAVEASLPLSFDARQGAQKCRRPDNAESGHASFIDTGRRDQRARGSSLGLTYLTSNGPTPLICTMVSPSAHAKCGMAAGR